jgi:hypothetical protein
LPLNIFNELLAILILIRSHLPNDEAKLIDDSPTIGLQNTQPFVAVETVQPDVEPSKPSLKITCAAI